MINYEKIYSQVSDEELLRLAERQSSLIEEASRAVRAEVQRRGGVAAIHTRKKEVQKTEKSPAVKIEKLSKAFYLISIAGGWGMALVLSRLSFAVSTRSQDVLIVLGLAGFAMIYALVVTMVLVYKMWAAIQDGHTRTTPGKAVGFLFIPLFNLYWPFQAFWGFAKDYNAYLHRHSLDVPKLPERLFLAYAILILVALIPMPIPFPGLLLAVINVSVLATMAGKICDALNALPTPATDGGKELRMLTFSP